MAFLYFFKISNYLIIRGIKGNQKPITILGSSLGPGPVPTVQFRIRVVLLHTEGSTKISKYFVSAVHTAYYPQFWKSYCFCILLVILRNHCSAKYRRSWPLYRFHVHCKSISRKCFLSDNKVWSSLHLYDFVEDF